MVDETAAPLGPPPVSPPPVVAPAQAAPALPGKLTRDMALGQPRPMQQAAVMAFGGRGRIVELDSKGRDSLDLLQATIAKKDGDDRARELVTAVWIVRCLFDTDGKRVFTDADVEAVAALPGSDLRPLWRTIVRLNALGDSDEADPDENP